MTYRGLHSEMLLLIGPHLKDNGYLPEVAFLVDSYEFGRRWLSVNAEILCALGTSRAMTSGYSTSHCRSFIVRYLGKFYEIDLICRTDELRGTRYDRLLIDPEQPYLYHLKHYAEQRMLLHFRGPDIRHSDIYLPFTEAQAEATVGQYAL